jgi:protein-S-isoprenylcysteine O-methyltransferase Ste14
MLVFGDYVFIPFAFSVQCHYLVGIQDYSHWAWTLPALLLFFIGYYLFRASNSQKNQFKTNPNELIWGEKPKTIGGKLLISGFWGLGRHMNYTGDLIMAVAYCLPCGWQVGGYFYFYYLLTLLVHRAYRDDAKCQEKYNELWKEYSRTVPQVFLPFEPLDFIFRGMGKLLYRLTNGSSSEAERGRRAEKQN